LRNSTRCWARFGHFGPCRFETAKQPTDLTGILCHVDDKTVARTISESNRIGVEFLLTDCQVALTLLDLAETTSVPEDRARRVGEAQEAYDTIVHLVRRLSPTGSETEELNANLSRLKNRLQDAQV
jgi:hypothetical protein